MIRKRFRAQIPRAHKKNWVKYGSLRRTIQDPLIKLASDNSLICELGLIKRPSLKEWGREDRGKFLTSTLELLTYVHTLEYTHAHTHMYTHTLSHMHMKRKKTLLWNIYTGEHTNTQVYILSHKWKENYCWKYMLSLY